MTGWFLGHKTDALEEETLSSVDPSNGQLLSPGMFKIEDVPPTDGIPGLWPETFYSILTVLFI